MNVGTPNKGYIVVDSVVALSGMYREQAAGWVADKATAVQLSEILSESGDYLVIDAQTGKVVA